MSITFNSFNSVYATSGFAHRALSSDDITVNPGGYLISTSNDALILGNTGQSYNVTVNGTIASHAAGYAGIYTGTPNNVFVTVNQGGTVYGEAAGLYLWSPATVINHGAIQANSSLSGAIHFANTSGDESIVNTGLISSANGAGIRFSSNGVHTVLNSGVISAGPGQDAIRSLNAAGIDNITNGGLINGDLELGGGADVLDTSNGRIAGTAYMGDGADVFAGSSFADTVYGGADNDILGGGSGADFLYGEAGADFIDGGAGVDHLSGGIDSDTYVVDHSLDLIDEIAGGGALDTVLAKVSFTLAANDHIEQLQTLTPTGTAAINLTGNGFAQGIQGNAGANRINGMGGNDVLAGGRGNDVLTGGANDDSFLFNTALNARTNVDRITDFSAPRDTIVLENSLPGTFRALVNGFLAESAFKANAAGVATDSNDRIIYNTSTGALFYDSNGSAAGGAIQFAVLSTKPAITHADFFVI